MRLIFIGPPGSGKGTQAKLLCQRHGLAHIATGDILREAVRQNTPEGLLAKSFVAAGQLVPDDIVIEIVAARFRSNNGPVDAFVMDGYPRTLAQAESFERALAHGNMDLDAVVFLKVDDQEIIRRLSGRWSCPNPKCQATFHLLFNPPKKTGVCNDCGAQLFQRDDDKEETVRHRLQIFHDRYADLLDYYRRRGLLVEVPGEGDIDAIAAQIDKALKKRSKKKSKH